MSFVFEIEFISPLLMGGQNGGGLDLQGLRGNSLRGCWRFWCRALLGGMLERNGGSGELLELENQLFGSTDRACFRLRITKVKNGRGTFVLLPHRKEEVQANKHLKKGYAVGSRFGIEIKPRPKQDRFGPGQQAALLASIWLWGYLGGIGNRCRRGFGSPVLVEAREAADSPSFASIGLNLRQEFEDGEDLCSYLRDGITTARNIFASWLIADGRQLVPESTLKAPNYDFEAQEYFILRNLRQVSVSNRSPFPTLDCERTSYSEDGVIAAIHGSSAAIPELGSAPIRNTGLKRHASPAFIRLHKVKEGWLPVCTWCPVTTIETTEKAVAYLRQCGFTY